MPIAPVLALRAFSGDDVAFFTALATDERITRFVGDGRPWGRGTIRARVTTAVENRSVQDQGAVRWFIATEGEHRVGLVVASRQDQDVEIGYWVAAECWGRGIAGAMVTQALPLVGQLFGTSCLTARVDPANTASARVLIRHGFRHDGHSEGLDRYVREDHSE